VRVLPRIKRLDDCLGDFIVRHPPLRGVPAHRAGALARLAGKSVTLAQLAKRMRCSQCRQKVAEVVAVARPRPCAMVKD
jgi:hypothetical protein